MIDLSVIIKYQLQEIGVTKYDEINLCTMCTSKNHSSELFSPQFYSYRRDASKEVQVSAIMITQ
jgi:copper oxidase (laccase) domain-containing protein